MCLIPDYFFAKCCVFLNVCVFWRVRCEMLLCFIKLCVFCVVFCESCCALTFRATIQLHKTFGREVIFFFSAYEKKYVNYICFIYFSFHFSVCSDKRFHILNCELKPTFSHFQHHNYFTTITHLIIIFLLLLSANATTQFLLRTH